MEVKDKGSINIIEGMYTLGTTESVARAYDEAALRFWGNRELIFPKMSHYCNNNNFNMLQPSRITPSRTPTKTTNISTDVLLILSLQTTKSQDFTKLYQFWSCATKKQIYYVGLRCINIFLQISCHIVGVYGTRAAEVLQETPPTWLSSTKLQPTIP